MKSIRILLIVLCIIILSLFTGCWNYSDVENQFVAMGMVVDINPETGDYIIYSEISRSKGASDATLITRLESAEGATIFEANRNLIGKISSKVYWGHTMVYIVSERVAEEGIIDVLDLLSSQTQVRSDIFLIVCDDDSTEKIFEFEDPIHDNVSQHLHDLLEFYEASGTFRRAPLFTVVQEIVSNEMSLMLPYIKMIEVEKKDEDKKGEEGKDEGESGDSEKSSTTKEKPSEIIIADGCVVFSGDKIVGKLSETETQSALIIKGELTSGYIFTLSNQEYLPNCTIEITKTDLKINPTSYEDNLYVQITLDLFVDLVELDTTINYKNSEKKTELEYAYEEMIKKELEAVIKITQHEYGVDIFGITGAVHRKENSFYKDHIGDWEDVYKDAKFNVEVNVNIESSSLTIEPLKVGK